MWYSGTKKNEFVVEMKTRPLNFLILFSLFLSTFLILACDDDSDGGPDFSKPGSQGALPPGVTEGERGMEYSVETLLPSPLVCGPPQRYEINVAVRQNVATCQNFNFQPLYQRAVNVANARISQLGCPENCRPLHQWDFARTWDCVEIDPANKFAVARVKYGVLCPNPGANLPQGLGPPPANSLTGSFREGQVDPIQGGDEVITEELGGFGVTVPCPTKDLVTINYFEKVPSCAGINYQPFVQRAISKARFHHGLQSCQATCNKKPFQQLRSVWNCQANVVNVDVFYMLECIRP